MSSTSAVASDGGGGIMIRLAAAPTVAPLPHVPSVPQQPQQPRRRVNYIVPAWTAMEEPEDEEPTPSAPPPVPHGPQAAAVDHVRDNFDIFRDCSLERRA